MGRCVPSLRWPPGQGFPSWSLRPRTLSRYRRCRYRSPAMHLGATLGRIRLDRRIAAALVALVMPACTGMFTSATTVMTPSGPVTAVLGDSDEFPRFTMPENGERLAD